MNKSYKTVWCESKNAWVAVSELSKSRGKKKTLTSAALALFLTMAGMGSTMAADITGTVTTPQSTTDTVVNIHDANINVATPPGTNAAVTINSSTTATVTIKDVVITSSASGSSYDPASPYSIKGTQGASAKLEGNNSITLNTAVAGGSGLIVSSDGGAGNATIDVAGTLNVANNSAGWWADANDGLKALASNGNATVSHLGSGKIQTVGGSAIVAFVTGNTVAGNAVVTLQGAGATNSIELETSGGLDYSSYKGNHGISASIEDTANTTGQVLITTNAKITTHGNHADGIHAQGQGGLVNINNAGTVTLSGTGSKGINAFNSSGDIQITNSGSITASGSNSGGISATNGSGSILITNSGNLSATGSDSNAINAKNAGHDIQITNSGNIVASGNNGIDEAIGISAGSISAAALTDGSETGTAVVIDQNNRTIHASTRGISVNAGTATVKSNSDIALQYTGASSHVIGIYVVAWNHAGNAYVEYDGSNGTGISINGNATNASSYMMGIFASDRGAVGDPASSGNATIVAAGDIAIAQNGGGATHFIYAIEANTYGVGDAAIHYKSGTVRIELNNGSTVDWGHGLVAQAFGSGDIYVQTDSGTKINIAGDNITGILLSSTAGSGPSFIWGDINSVIETDGVNAHGIRITADSSAQVDLTNRGHIATLGAGAHGILVNNRGDAKSAITNTGNIETHGQNANAIHVTSTHAAYAGEAVAIVNTGNLNTVDAKGIYAHSVSGGVTVVSTGDITAAQATPATQSYGIEVSSLTDKAAVAYDRGTIRVSGDANGGGNAIGVVAWDANSTNAAQASSITLGSQAIVDATHGVGGLQIHTSGKGLINIDSGAQVHGGSGYGIEIGGSGTAATYEINNAGTIGSVNDLAILSGGQAGSMLTVNNHGTITGYIDSAAAQVVFNNYSPNSLNLRNYYDSDGDGMADTKAVSVSTFGGGTFNNTATGTLRLLAVRGEQHTVTAGEYVPAGALSLANPGVVHAQMLNLNTFDHAGTIDMSDNATAGDVLVITGAAMPGVYGGGAYISNGGILKMDTLLNSGGVNSLSDMLVLDDVMQGSGATQIHISPAAGSLGSLTEGDGIKVIEVTGQGQGTDFSLITPTFYGLYEYKLVQGGSSPASAQNWYLRNNANGQLFYAPITGVYTANQYVAGHMFNHHILDRRNNVREPDRTLWARVNYGENQFDQFNRQHRTDTDTTVIQIGADLYQRKSIVAGIFAGYGHSSIDNRSSLSNSLTSGKVDGYQIGLYGSWLPEENKGPYADLWAHYAWFDNELNNAAMLHAAKYDATGYTISVEGGYTFELSNNEDGSAWLLEPHVQVIYSNIDADSFDAQLSQAVSTHFDGHSASGFQSRVGARLYAQNSAGQQGVSPFIEVNWLHNNITYKAKSDGSSIDSQIGREVGELKVGVQGMVGDKFSLWGHMGVQKGQNDFERYEVQLGLGWQW